MSYVLTPYGKTRRRLAGVPWRDLSDAEYKAATALHPDMEVQGYFAHVADEESPPPSSRRRLKEETDV